MANKAAQAILIVACTYLCSVVAAAGERTGYVSQSGAAANTTTLVEALKDQRITVSRYV
jgi:hypothetical protein